jgi:hypothetical protein
VELFLPFLIQEYKAEGTEKASKGSVLVEGSYGRRIASGEVLTISWYLWFKSCTYIWRATWQFIEGVFGLCFLFIKLLQELKLELE